MKNAIWIITILVITYFVLLFGGTAVQRSWLQFNTDGIYIDPENGHIITAGSVRVSAWIAAFLTIVDTVLIYLWLQFRKKRKP